jgi:hypothetical protein
MAEDLNTSDPESDFATLRPGQLWLRPGGQAARHDFGCARNSEFWRDVTIKKSGERSLGQERPRFFCAGAMPSGRVRFVYLIVAAAFAFANGSGANAASFDGNWIVLQVCDSSQEATRGYPWVYDATVKGGHLVGHYRNRGNNLSILLEGEIKSDGSAALDYTESSTVAPSPIVYRVAVKFDVASGTGNRLGMRSCKFVFTRQ